MSVAGYTEVQKAAVACVTVGFEGTKFFICCFYFMNKKKGKWGSAGHDKKQVLKLCCAGKCLF